MDPNVSIKLCVVRFASFLSSGFSNMAVINPPEKKLANRTSVHCLKKEWTLEFLLYKQNLSFLIASQSRYQLMNALCPQARVRLLSAAPEAE